MIFPKGAGDFFQRFVHHGLHGEGGILAVAAAVADLL